MIGAVQQNVTVNDDGQIVVRFKSELVTIEPTTYTRAESAQVAAAVAARRIGDGSWPESETLGDFVRRIFPQKEPK